MFSVVPNDSTRRESWELVGRDVKFAAKNSRVCIGLRVVSL